MTEILNGRCRDKVAELDLDRYRIAESSYWTQSIAPGKFYKRICNGSQIGTAALKTLQQQFETNVLEIINSAKSEKSQPGPSQLPDTHICTSHNSSNSPHLNGKCHSSDDNSSSVSDDTEEDNKMNDLKESNGRKFRIKGNSSRKLTPSVRPEKKSSLAQKEIHRKRNHPSVLHPDLGFNEPGQLNDGPHCKCSWAAKQTGIRHDKFAGEKPARKCDWNSSNVDRLHHYVLVVEPKPSKVSRRATAIRLDGHVYEFDGFSVFFHQPIPENFPQQPINQWTDEFQVRLVKENMPESFTINDLELFHTYLFDHILELYDLQRSMDNLTSGKSEKSSCYFYHCFPRFARELPDDGKELLPMSAVLAHFCREFSPFGNERMSKQFSNDKAALRQFLLSRKGQIFLNPTKHPMALRVDLIDAYNLDRTNSDFCPLLVHFGIKPNAYAFSKRPQYQDALKKHIKFRKEIFTRSKVPTSEEKRLLQESEMNLQHLKQECIAKRETTIRVESRGFYTTGLYPDIVQYAMLLVLMCHHIRFHCSLGVLEIDRIAYVFKNRGLLELALIHPSFRTNYGTNPDHAKNTMNNCGLRLDKNVCKRKRMTSMERKRETISADNHFSKATSNKSPKKCTPHNQQQSSNRKRGIQALMEIMSLQGSKQVAESPLRHNERLEFLGDAIVEFLTTIHLFFLFTDLDEGGLATFRSALVQNRHLATLADRMGLQQFMVYAHGPDLCHETDLRHAMANAFEALMAAIFLDSNLMECDRIFANVLFKDEPSLKKIWVTLPEHPLKRHNPLGDRHLIEKVPCLKLLSEFEKSIGVNFKHIRLLAKAFTRRNVPYNYLTLGNNQRLEFLGDTVLQLLTTEYLYKHFPYHQEGHLSLLRTCLVSNKTQSVVCDELSMTNYLVIPQVLLRKGPQAQLRLKDKADLNEAFLGALYVDRGLIYCRQFCQTCFFPRLEYFIMTQRWNDPKSQLQQCCLALREGGTGDPDIPEYKTIGIEGPTNTRMYRVAVYFRNKRLADGVGHSVHQAQMQAAENALEKHAHIFPTFNTNQAKSQKENGFDHGNDQSYDKFDEDQSTNDGSEGRMKSFTSMDVDRRKSCKDSENDNRYLETSKTKLVGNQRGYKKTREEDDEKDRQSIPTAKRSRVLMRKEERRPSGIGTLDKSYVTPRIEAIHKVILKSQKQVNRRPHQLLKRIAKTSYISRRHSPETSHFYFNNTTPRLTQCRQTPMTIVTKMTNRISPIVGQQSTNGFNLALLPPPPPPPPPPGPLSAPSSPLRPQNSAQLQSEPSSMPFVLAPPPPPPEMP